MFAEQLAEHKGAKVPETRVFLDVERLLLRATDSVDKRDFIAAEGLLRQTLKLERSKVQTQEINRLWQTVASSQEMLEDERLGLITTSKRVARRGFLFPSHTGRFWGL
jgi:hypothetical protein